MLDDINNIRSLIRSLGLIHHPCGPEADLQLRGAL